MTTIEEIKKEWAPLYAAWICNRRSKGLSESDSEFLIHLESAKRFLWWLDKHGTCLNPAERVTTDEKIYVASSASIPDQVAMWRRFRDTNGVPIISSWIDESGENETGDYTELWDRITSEIRRASLIVLYAEPGDFPLKGALIEVGIALGMSKPVIVCLPAVELEQRSCRPIGSWIMHRLVERNDNINEVMKESFIESVLRGVRIQ